MSSWKHIHIFGGRTKQTSVWTCSHREVSVQPKKNHLKRCHLKELQQVQEKDQQEKKPWKGQLTIAKAFEGKPLYSKDSDRYNQLTQKLAIFIGSTNVAISLVENDEFKKLTDPSDPEYDPLFVHCWTQDIDSCVVERRWTQQNNICWRKKQKMADLIHLSEHNHRLWWRKDHQWSDSVTLQEYFSKKWRTTSKK